MTKKQEYIGAFLDGYFFDKKFSQYDFEYVRAVEDAEKKAKKKWKQYKKQRLL
jgi:hypothetical protein